MVYKCVAAGCSNITSDKVTIFKFPSDSVLRNKWKKQVQRTRDDWKATKHSHLCSEHFTEDCFEVEPTLAAEFGISKKRRLKPGAVPSIFPRPKPTVSGGQTSAKRPATSTPDSAPTTKKKREAFEKRERARILEDLMGPSSSTTAHVESAEFEENEPDPELKYKEIGVQARITCSKRNVRTQTSPKTSSKCIQVHSLSVTQDASVQCDLLLHPLCPVERGVQCNLGPSSSTPTHDPFESSLDTTVMDTSTGTFIPSQESSSQSEEPSADDATGPPLPPERQRTYLVFETSLLLLFMICSYCGKGITKVKKRVIGSFLHITQWCEKCKKKSQMG